ncbi:trypsin-like peptidase domain-containing protein [Prosthecobacter dejongeii]|uniref:Serine protease Do n=1 Tax=Prosthecobacter dejongeii TaxID=48465 RepID=A0A7W7YIB0_9BACT|nr:trypsin-like peptidase domain-containing protein [Prosthecobacter dejongeii]MBB5036659.1 serine protease Do [Prosthecobacter dejongeii]
MLTRYLFYFLSFVSGVVSADSLERTGSLEAQISRDHAPLLGGGQVVLSYADVVEKVRDSVVTVFVTQQKIAEPENSSSEGNPFDLSQKKRMEAEPEDEAFKGSGSGVIISSEGWIITNAHVVNQADKISVRLRGQETDIEALVAGMDPATDIALLKIQQPTLKAATLADSLRVRPGDVVLAIGSPFGLEQTITLGIISATGRGALGLIEGGMEDFIQTDAAINPGNSGGPLLDGLGRVVGINTARYWGDNIGFAVPVNLVLKVASDLHRYGWVVRGFLGVHTLEVTPKLIEDLKLPKKAKGVLVKSVETGEAADLAGFKEADLIVEVNGRKVENGMRFRLGLASLQPGDKATFEVLRQGQKISLQAIMGEPPELKRLQAEKAQTPDVVEWAPGLWVAEASRDWKMRFKLSPQVAGLIVTQDLKSKDGTTQLRAGDQILLINGQPAQNHAQARSRLATLKAPTLLLKIRSGQEERFIAIPR